MKRRLGFALACMLAGAPAGADAPVALVAAINAPASATTSIWGRAIDASGPFVAIGAAREEIDGEARGAVYVYRRLPEGDFVLETRLQPPSADLQLPFWAGYGNTVSIDRGTLAVGSAASAGAVPQAGAVYLYTRSADGWVFQQSIVAPDGAAGDQFGGAIALSGDRLLVGAPEAGANGANPGRVYVFRRDADGRWAWEASLMAPSDGDRFGVRVALDGDLGVIGEPKAYDSRAHIIRSSGGLWRITDTLTPNEDRFSAGIGLGIAVSGNTVVVGGPNALMPNGGRGGAFLYTVDEAGVATGITAFSLNTTTYSGIGYTAAIADGVVMLGARSGDGFAGRLFAYRRTPAGEWTGPLTISGDENYGEAFIYEPPLLYVRNDGVAGGLTNTGVLHLGQFAGVPMIGPPPADLNGDGVVDAADLGALLGAWGPVTP